MQSKHKCVVKIKITFEMRARRQRTACSDTLSSFLLEAQSCLAPFNFCCFFIFYFPAGSADREQRSKVKFDHANFWAHVYVKVSYNNDIFNNPVNKSCLGHEVQMNNNYNYLRISVSFVMLITNCFYTSNRIINSVNLPFI